MHNSIYIQCMFPNKSSNSWVLLEYFRIAIFIRIDSGRSFNREIINKNVGYLRISSLKIKTIHF